MKLPVFTFISLLAFLITCETASGQVSDKESASKVYPMKVDTTKHYDIREILVTESMRKAELGSLTPLQVFGTDQIHRMNVLGVADLLKFMAGVNLKDYGGVGGLKTVSVRSLGAGHTAINLDGVVVSDVLTGQIDLSRFSLDRISSISLNQGQSANLFQPARNFASASTLNIHSNKPMLDGERPVEGGLNLKAGSFGLVNPSFWLNARISQRWVSSVNLEMIKSRGDYPYTMTYGTQAGDSSTTGIRNNGDVATTRAEVTFFGELPHGYKLESRQYFWSSDRGLPGATLFYSSQDQARQRLSEHAVFTQGKLSRSLSDKFAFALHWKLGGNSMNYTDPDFLNGRGGISDSYHQQEAYLSGNICWTPSPNWSFGWSNDVFSTSMQTSIPDYIKPLRYNWLSFAGSTYRNDWMNVQASVLSTRVSESAFVDKRFDKLSPYAGIAIHPKILQGVNLRMFYKDIFRLPTFNDMYYPLMGNKDLKPEKASQINLGLNWMHRFSDILPEISFSADAYQNRVRDKIVAFPNKSSFSWTILNFGRVDIRGLDLSMDVQIVPVPGASYRIDLNATHTYTRALDMTDQASGQYGQQIPYTPRVSGSAGMNLITPWINAGLNMIWSGHRYVLPENYAENNLPGYKDISLNLYRDFKFGNYLLGVKLEALNLLNENYSVIRWFPMPGRNYRAGFSFKF